MAIFPCVAWENHMSAGGRKSGLTSQCALWPSGKLPIRFQNAAICDFILGIFLRKAKHRQVTDLDVTDLGFAGPGLRLRGRGSVGTRHGLFSQSFPSKYLSSMLGRTELCQEVRNPGPQKPQIIHNEQHHLAFFCDFSEVRLVRELRFLFNSVHTRCIGKDNVDLQGVFVKIGDFTKFKDFLVEFLQNSRF